MSIYNYDVTTLTGEQFSLERYKGKVLIITNTASKCGFTPQYADLQRLYTRYKEQGMEIIGFPCNQFGEQEPGSNTEVGKFCELNYGVTFTITEKTDVRGPEAHPVFKELVNAAPFKGFDEDHFHAKLLNKILEEKYPHYLHDDSIKWNFTKFLIDREGNIVERYEPTTDPMDMEDAIRDLL
ncbi:glutathione peroxidase [Paenibacillus marinisediminis]